MSHTSPSYGTKRTILRTLLLGGCAVMLGASFIWSRHPPTTAAPHKEVHTEPREAKVWSCELIPESDGQYELAISFRPRSYNDPGIAARTAYSAKPHAKGEIVYVLERQEKRGGFVNMLFFVAAKKE